MALGPAVLNLTGLLRTEASRCFCELGVPRTAEGMCPQLTGSSSLLSPGSLGKLSCLHTRCLARWAGSCPPTFPEGSEALGNGWSPNSLYYPLGVLIFLLSPGLCRLVCRAGAATSWGCCCEWPWCGSEHSPPGDVLEVQVTSGPRGHDPSLGCPQAGG